MPLWVDYSVSCAWLLGHAVVLAFGVWNYRRESRTSDYIVFPGYWLFFLGPPGLVALVLAAVFGFASWPGRVALGLSAVWCWYFVRILVELATTREQTVRPDSPCRNLTD